MGKYFPEGFWDVFTFNDCSNLDSLSESACYLGNTLELISSIGLVLLGIIASISLGFLIGTRLYIISKSKEEK